jgi:hypothetical protein
VNLRNDGMMTTDVEGCTAKYEQWHAEVLEEAENLSSDLRHLLDPIDKMPLERVQVDDEKHRINVSVMSEMLFRLRLAHPGRPPGSAGEAAKV